MIFPPPNPPFRHETEVGPDGSERIVLVRRPDDEWFEHRDGFLTRVYIAEGEEKRMILLRRFDVIGRYPPEGAAFEWGFRLRLNGAETKLPSRIAFSDAGLGQFFDAHGFKHCKASLVFVPRFFEWMT